MSKMFVISDLHLGHEKLAKLRGFVDSMEQIDHIISKWNSVVSKRDVVWILGDIALHKSFYVYLDSLNGIKKVVLGNHDKPNMIQELLKHVNCVCGSFEYKGMIFTHIPISITQLDRYSKNIHGHLHKDFIYNIPEYVNVCCEVIDYTPLEVSKLMKGLR